MTAIKDKLFELLPKPDAFLALEPEELAGVVLECLNSMPEQERLDMNRHNFSLHYTVANYPQDHWANLQRALMEAWAWLEREGLIAQEPEKDTGWCFITRRGRSLAKAADVMAYRKANLLPREQLHPILAQKVWALFLRGDYDVAVFQAYKEVEVAVRSASGLSVNDLGTDLMRKAFNPDGGPLTDQGLPKSERESMAHLFAGAIGCYKNPHSHRAVPLGAQEAVEMIVLASHLLRIVDERAAGGATQAP